MKLKTVLRIDDLYAAPIGDDGDMSADSAAAHALMQAMCQYESDFPLSAAAPQDVIQWIEKRADALLKQWGFDTGEGA